MLFKKHLENWLAQKTSSNTTSLVNNSTTVTLWLRKYNDHSPFPPPSLNLHPFHDQQIFI